MNSNNDIHLKPIPLGDDYLCQLSILRQLDADDMTMTIYEKNKDGSRGKPMFVTDIFPYQALKVAEALRLQIDVYSGVIANDEPTQQFDRFTGHYEPLLDEEE